MCVTSRCARISRISRVVTFTYFALHLVGYPPLRPQTARKLSTHLINSYTAGVSNIVAGHPRALKIVDLGSGMLQAARAYKAGTPAGIIVLGIYPPTRYVMTDDPAVSATTVWTTVSQPQVSALSA